MDAQPQQPVLGIDVGGTKTLAALVAPGGAILARKRAPTPRDLPPEDTFKAVLALAAELLAESAGGPSAVAAAGIAIPGVVDADTGRVVVTPNMNLSGLEAGTIARRRLGVPVVIGNDVNLGTLGEYRLGAARGARSAVGIFVGTGIGGGIIIDGKLIQGARSAAAEIGHIVMQIDGPPCGCGNRGCLEALASRAAIERDIRAAVSQGRPTLLTELAGGDLSVIRSGVLRKALKRGDALVSQVLRGAAVVLGHACLTVRHLLDPDVIIMGGGLMEACGEFLMPIIEQVVSADALAGARPGGRVVISALGDDAVVLGAAALAGQRLA